MLTMKLPRDQKERIIDSLKAFYWKERGEEIGSVAAEQLLDHVIADIGPVIYNQAITAARKVVAERMASIEDELYALEAPDRTKG
jgi:uncharacterized protein (DUF2164 family)